MQPSSPRYGGGALRCLRRLSLSGICVFAQAEDFGLSNFRIADSSAWDQCFEHQISRLD